MCVLQYTVQHLTLLHRQLTLTHHVYAATHQQLTLLPPCVCVCVCVLQHTNS